VALWKFRVAPTNLGSCGGGNNIRSSLNDSLIKIKENKRTITSYDISIFNYVLISFIQFVPH